MISLIPKADSWSGRLLSQLGRMLGLRSETVYSRAILLLALCQFIVLGAAVVFVWLTVMSMFEKAEDKDLLAVAGRARDYAALHPEIPPQRIVQSVSALSGRIAEWHPGPARVPAEGIRLEKENGQAFAGFAVPAADGRPLGEMILKGTSPLFDAGKLAVRVFVVGLAIAGGLMLLIMLLVVDRTIVGRIQLLAEKVEQKKHSERLPVKLDYPGDDELAMLAHSIEGLALLVQQAEREYRHVVEDQTESICRFDSDDKITFSNKAFETLCATAPAGKQTPLFSCFGSGMRTAVERGLADCSPVSPVSKFVHAGPGGRWYRSTLHASFDGAGRRTGAQLISADVTQEVVAQNKLQDSQRQLARLSAKLMTLQDEERRRLARELHDSTAQSLAALEINMSALSATKDPVRVKRLSEEAGAISRQVCDELRTISYLLHPPLLEEAGLVFALRWLADGFTKRNNIPVSVEVSEDFPRFSPHLETALFRIVQESLSNIYRHAGASKAWIALGRGDDGAISLEIRDNGEGLPDDFSLSRSSGVGLAGMRERMRELGGTLDIESSEFGVAVRCRLVEENSFATDERG